MDSKEKFPPIPTLIVTGPVGVGKTSVANAISELLNSQGKPHALIDIDSLRQCYPSPADDPFQIKVGLRNLAAVTQNYREAGAKQLILVDVVETRGEIGDYQMAIPGVQIQIVRLQASLQTLHRRLEQRETGDSLRWHQERAAELLDLMNRERVENILMETENKSVQQIAEEIIELVGWED